MNRGFIPLLFAMLMVISACGTMPTKYPPGPGQNPSLNSGAPGDPQPAQVTGAQRMQYAWNKAMEGVAMGGSIAGPYGAGGGLIIGLLTGLFMADSHYNELNRQINTEQQKDRQLENAIDQELARQRELDNQITNQGAAPPGAATAQSIPPVAPAQSAPPGAPAQQNPLRQNPPATHVPENFQTAALTKPVTPSAAPSPFKNVEVRDINGDGIPDLWIYYNPQKPGEIMRQEESSKGDGRVDTWSYFKDGQLTRREVDSKGQGRPDTIFYYDNDKIVREERDENGQGRMTYRATYQDGRVAKVEKDTNGNGRPDLWIYYDTSRDGEIVVKEERDLNGDGVADLWSYYENGRLVRRDVNSVGLEILSKQDQLPAASVGLKQISVPGS